MSSIQLINSKLHKQGVIRPMTDKSQWAKSDPRFKVHPPITKRLVGRPKKKCIPGVLELTSKKQQCKRCK
jgi:hypothetical protein